MKIQISNLKHDMILHNPCTHFVFIPMIQHPVAFCQTVYSNQSALDLEKNKQTKVFKIQSKHNFLSSLLIKYWGAECFLDGK